MIWDRGFVVDQWCVTVCLTGERAINLGLGFEIGDLEIVQREVKPSFYMCFLSWCCDVFNKLVQRVHLKVEVRAKSENFGGKSWKMLKRRKWIPIAQATCQATCNSPEHLA
ncbi:hypothetical protein Dsin_001470 [Dipteronia sinensis]|uniref:Uncharacterized protein n=1 Tax=Dipteronia sinensis TaxID=43782 RepID=A0AAE0B5F4_9ROSI|nr:hypothetical protein Dsin_001470 [Dipteronia sinensis]